MDYDHIYQDYKLWFAKGSQSVKAACVKRLMLTKTRIDVTLACNDFNLAYDWDKLKKKESEGKIVLIQNVVFFL